MSPRWLRLARLIVVVCASGCGSLGFSTSALATAPLVQGEAFSGVGSSSASVSAQVNPEGSLSNYFFEYGTSTAYGSATSPTSLGSGSEVVEVPADLPDLSPATVYHFRVSVTNSSGETAHGPDDFFTTLPVGLLGLPDRRVYELVTPADNHDADVYTPEENGVADSVESDGFETELPFQAAADGHAVAYVAAPTSGGNGSAGKGLGNEYVAIRSPAGGWSQRSLQPSAIAIGAGYQAFSSDLSAGFISGYAIGSVTPGAPEHSILLYQRNSEDGSYRVLTPTLPANGRFFEAPNVSLPFAGEGPAYAGSSLDLSHVLFEVNNILTLDAVEGADGEQENNLYDSIDGQLHLVNVLPSGQTEDNATFGSLGNFSHAISDAGNRIFWTDLHNGSLYVRENDSQPQSPIEGTHCTVSSDACTVQVDASQGAGNSGGGHFWTASANGSKVFFTDESRLTADSTATAGMPDLYEYNVETGGMVDLTVAGTGAGEQAAVEGVVGASEDGGYVYFIASGSLAPGAIEGQPNLYLRHDGVTKFLTLDDDIPSGIKRRTSEVAPDGHSVVFQSALSLTGYDKKGMTEVYVYETEDGGHLFCASCSPSGEPPLPGSYLPVSDGNLHADQWVSEDGTRVFFNSTQSLVAEDTNGQQDVYEWERDGAGSCQGAEGCLYLLSGGTSADSSWLLDASVSGDDAFVITRAQLAPQDQNEVFDVYDARVDGEQPLTPPQCSGSGCQGVPGAPPIFATPSSVTFEGVGNFSRTPSTAVTRKTRALTKTQKRVRALKACSRDRLRRKRTRCEERVKNLYAAKPKAKKSAKERV